MADLHDFRLTPQGTALITSYAPVLCDLAAVDGPARGGIVDATFQEVDVRTGLVMYEWTSLDHVAVGESYERLRADTLALPYDYFHINSINLNEDGTLMISARNTWTVYDIDPPRG